MFFLIACHNDSKKTDTRSSEAPGVYSSARLFRAVAQSCRFHFPSDSYRQSYELQSPAPCAAGTERPVPNGILCYSTESETAHYRIASVVGTGGVYPELQHATRHMYRTRNPPIPFKLSDISEIYQKQTGLIQTIKDFGGVKLITVSSASATSSSTLRDSFSISHSLIE